MRNKIIKLIPILIITVYFGLAFGLAYNANYNPYRDLSLYTIEPLKIGVIGEIPNNVREDIIEFHQIQFKDIENNEFNSEYDAIFITKVNLSEAAQDKYATVYKTSKIPFYFIGTEKGTLPFTEENLSYEDAAVISNNVLVQGILYKNIILGGSWASNRKNPSMSAVDYSLVFQSIYDLKHSE